MSYIKDKTIIDFLIQVEKLIQPLNTKFEPIYSFTLGHIWHSSLKSPSNLQSTLEAFSLLHQYEEFQAISNSQRNSLLLEMLIDPLGNLEQKIIAMTSEDQEESKENSQPNQNSTYFKERRQKCMELYDKAELKLVEHLALIEEEDARMLPIDLVLWGFFTAYLQSRPFATQVDASSDSVFEKLWTLCQAQISQILTHNQKMRLFIKLYNEWELDLNQSFAKLLENPSLGSKPISSLVVDEQKMNEVMLQQYALEDKIEQEKARQEQERKDNEGISCNICLLDLYDKDEDVYFMDICVHNYHESCLHDYLKTQVKARKFPVKCPEHGCRAEFTEADLKELMTEQDVEAYYEAALDEFIKKNGQNMSYCPSPDCPYAFVMFPGETEFECPVCLTEYCLECREVKHEGDCRAKDFIEFARNNKYKACPKCKFWIEKTVGCNNMICRCGFHFCYRCGKASNNHAVCDPNAYYSSLKDRLKTSVAIQEYLFDNERVIIPDYGGNNPEAFHNDRYKIKAQRASMKNKGKGLKNKKKQK